MKCFSGFLSFGCLLLVAFGAACSTPSSPSTSSQPIYDPRADGERQLSQALKKARKESKYVLLDLGANWCTDSQAMYRLLQQDPAIVSELKRHYILTTIDVNQRDNPARNTKLVEHLGNPLSRGIPVLLVLTPDGELINKDAAERLGDDAHKDPGKVLAYLLKWAPPAGSGGL